MVGAEPAPKRIGDAAFLRRASVDATGQIPTREQVNAFLADTRADKREKAVDRLLADPNWAENWVGYWQDVLAENPGIVKPKLNNTGPFDITGHPSISIPCAKSNGLPVGLMLTGRHFDESTLYHVSYS